VASGPVANIEILISASGHVHPPIKPPPALSPSESVTTKPPNLPGMESIDISPSLMDVKVLDG